MRWFPFDIQRCELKFGSWTFDGWLLDIQMKEADVSGYMPNGEWDLLGRISCQKHGWQTVLLSNCAYINTMQYCNCKDSHNEYILYMSACLICCHRTWRTWMLFAMMFYISIHVYIVIKYPMQHGIIIFIASVLDFYSLLRALFL